MILWRKEREIEQAIEEYLAEAEQCLQSFSSAFDGYFSDGLDERFEELAQETGRAESRADSKRREIEAAMYGGALIPGSRGDILGMLESLDLVPNKAESVLYQIWLQSMSVPDQFVEDIKALVRANCEAFALLCQAARMIFTDLPRVGEVAAQVTAKEEESDDFERRLIKSIFDSAPEVIDKADRILLKELILEIGSISDRAENAADRLRIIAIKRQA